MNVVDSSGWLEYFADAPNVHHFARAIEEVSLLLVPSISIYEVFKRVRAQRTEHEAFLAVAQMQQGKVIDLDASLSISAALLSRELKLPMADSIILATARRYDAVLWTQDSDFAGIEGVRFIAKRE